jgi:hypothetical protein
VLLAPNQVGPGIAVLGTSIVAFSIWLAILGSVSA